MEVIQHRSPNFGPRRDGLTPTLIVLHYTAMASAKAALDRMCDPLPEVSAHYLISRRGETYQLVEEDMRAWHAGAGRWGGLDDINSRSIGIELDNDGASPFSEPLMSALETLLGGIRQRRDIPPQGVIAHSDFAPARKCDPGRRFDWQRLALGGHAVWHSGGEATGDETAFLNAAEAFGYPVEEGFDVVLDAFRQRFRPHASGALCPADIGAICDLAARYPAHRAIDPAAPSA